MNTSSTMITPDIQDIMSTRLVSKECAIDVAYLRTRNRWSEKLEEQLIALHEAGIPPNVMSFGCTPESGQALLDSALAQLELNPDKQKAYTETDLTWQASAR